MKNEQEQGDRIEQSVLGGILINNGILPGSVIDLEPEYFRDILHSRIFAAIQVLIEQHVTPDEVSVSKQLVESGGKPTMVYLAELAGGVTTNANLDHWAKILGDDGRQRKIVADVKSAIEKTKNKTAKEIEFAVTEAMGGIKKQRTGGYKHIREFVQPSLDIATEDEESTGAASIVKTGLTELDQMVKLKPGDMTTIAARPSMGKSALAANIARYAAKNISGGIVAVASLEDSGVSLTTRILSSLARIDSREFKRAITQGQLVEACQEVYELNMAIDETSGVDVEDIRAAILRLGEVRLLIVDYLQLVKMPRSRENHSLTIGRVTKGLKTLSKEIGCHTILLSQLNRGLESRSPPIPKLSDLKESGSIEEDSDCVFFIYRESYYDSRKPIQDADLIVAKQRNGPTGMVKMHWSPTTQTFSDAEN